MFNPLSARTFRFVPLLSKTSVFESDSGGAFFLTSAPADLGGKKPTLYRHPTAEHDPIQNSARRKPIGSTATLAVLKFRGSWQRGP
jgi:hypothetical protein